ncbi:uncharacterized protein HGUI_01909 [Hanseniaspora guilliermondii]|uniref:TAFII55 protein conserved region domain-containing protein n=1 Tax=Hanseniaspora guilliermondii TaxID=56406 RepID=A0A1L0CLF9_9ASCO|nr:uncharacterized protein HGUI_01909 [Hanseniaspora guilliermondii]
MSLPRIKLNIPNNIQGETNPLIESSVILRVSNNLNTGLLSKTDIMELLNYDDCINIEYLGLNKLILSINLNIIGSESIEYYACELLNLPTVVEVYKSIDNGKNMLKNNNINQVIYVHKKINKYEDIFNVKADYLNSELINEDANDDPIYNEFYQKDRKDLIQLYDNLKKIDFKNNKKYDMILNNLKQKTYNTHNNILRNGLTAPLHNVLKRRQRKQLSLTQIKKLEYTLNKLVQNDLLSESVEYEFVSETEIDNDDNDDNNNNITVANDDHLKNQLKNVIQQQKVEESEESDLELELEKVLLEQEEDKDNDDNEEDDDEDDDVDEPAADQEQQEEELEEEDNQQNDFDEDDELSLLIDELKSLQTVKQTNLKSFHNCKNQFMKERILERLKKIDKEIEVIETKIQNMKHQDEEVEEEEQDIDGLFSEDEPENDTNDVEQEPNVPVEELKPTNQEKDSDYYESDDDMLELFGGSDVED